MALIRRGDTDVVLPLVARHIVGRSRICVLRIDDDTISGIHAEFVWEDERWRLHDLGSRNGSFVDGRKLDPGQFAELTIGNEIKFGHAQPSFHVLELDAPRLTALTEAGQVRLASDDFLALPDTEDCAVTAFRGQDGEWMLEDEVTTRVIAEQDEVEIAGCRWRIFPPGSLSRTREHVDAPRLAEVALEFRVSRDQEHVEISLLHPGGTTPLETRAHGMFLLGLARARLTDAGQEHLGQTEHGWRYREDLTREFDVTLRLLNLWVFRARKQLGELGIDGAAGLIERRADAEQLRIGIARLVVVEA